MSQEKIPWGGISSPRRKQPEANANTVSNTATSPAGNPLEDPIDTAAVNDEADQLANNMPNITVTSPVGNPLEDPFDTAAANAEADRLAHELGVASTSNKKYSRPWSFGESSKRSFGSVRSNNSNVRAIKNMTSGLDGSSLQRQISIQNQIKSHNNSSGTGGYIPPMELEGPDRETHLQYQPSVADDRLKVFDENGNIAPYKEGPFMVYRDDQGRILKKRWCKSIISL